MKKVLLAVAIVMFALVLTSCVSPHYLSDFDVLRPGMSEAEVIKVLGKPDTRGYRNDTYIYTYNNVLPSFFSDDYCVYEVMFKDGVVVGYGQASYQYSSDTYVYVESSNN
jgi:outer membrane protein assembly factor BamE (lipoprotein component of BamABCDE complex)